MINIYEQLKKEGYLLLDGDEFDIESMDMLKTTFEGYPKTRATIMLSYFDLPTWTTLILFDPSLPKVKQAIEDFSKSASSFFVRSDTQFNKIDNLNFRDGTRQNLMDDILKIKDYDNRWVIVLAVPNDPGQEFRNVANCRMGRINGVVTQEWTGSGFSEYHLGKDKFPHKSALHAVIQLNEDGSCKHTYQVTKEQYLADLTTLLRAYGLESFKLKRKLIDAHYYKEIVGKEYAGKEPNNEELENASNLWLEKEHITSEDLIKLGSEYITVDGKVPESVSAYKTKYGPWKPKKSQIDYLIERFTVFEERCQKLGISTEGKILTCSFNDSNKGYNKYGVIFWDIFNLL